MSPLLHQNESFPDIDFIAEHHEARLASYSRFDEQSSPFLRAVARRVQHRSYYQDLQSQMLAESRRLQRYLEQQHRKNGRRVFVFTSAYKNEGVSTVVLNLAKAFEYSGRGYRVLIVDANIKSPGLTRFLGGRALGMGLLDLLAGDCDTHGIFQKLAGAEIYFLGHGRKRRDAEKLIQFDRLKAQLRFLESLFDFIIIAAPPVELFPDGYLWARLAGGMILVVHAYRTPLRAIKNIKRRMRKYRLEIFGTILNRRQFAIPKFAYEWV